MRTLDLGQMVVTYNLIIGILVMLASERVGSIAGYLNRVHRERITRFTSLSSFTFGTCVSVISGSVLIVYYLPS